MRSITFTVPGRVASSNRNWRGGAGGYHSANSVNWKQLTRGAAVEAIAKHGWKAPDCARIAVALYHTSVDVDNAQVTTVNALKGRMIVDDNRKHLRGIAVEHCDDDGEPVPRMVITITECEMLASEANRKVRKRKPKPLPQFAAASKLNKQVDAIDFRRDFKPGELVRPEMVQAVLKKQGVR